MLGHINNTTNYRKIIDGFCVKGWGGEKVFPLNFHYFIQMLAIS